MKTDTTNLLAVAVTAALCLATAPAQGTFADPVRLQAGGKLLGENRLYPSPAYHDVNGDGLADIAVGDLFGNITVALREPGDGVPTFGEEKRMKALDGKDLDFGNW